MRRRKHFRRAGGNHILVMLAVVVAVGTLGIWAFDVPHRMQSAGASTVPDDVASGTGTAAVSAARDAGEPADTPARAGVRADGERAAVLPGAMAGTGLPDDFTLSLAASAGAVNPDEGGSTNGLNPGLAADLQATAQRAQEQLEALGHAQGDSIPEDDPAVLQQLPPEIRELYRARQDW
jgi:hypothetical protein